MIVNINEVLRLFLLKQGLYHCEFANPVISCSPLLFDDKLISTLLGILVGSFEIVGTSVMVLMWCLLYRMQTRYLRQ